MPSVPDFVTRARSAVSGRLLCRGRPGTGDPITPAVLEAHLLPGLIGSSVYVLGAVGPSVSAWPYFPLGGVVVSDHGELTVLAMDDDRAYWFAKAETTGTAPDDFDYSEIESPEDLIDWALRSSADNLGLEPWDAELVGELLDACEGCPHFDQFMTLPEASFPDAV